jgi:putative endonuclease
MREHAYVVYIMTDSRRGVLYVGVTSELQTRAHQHRNGEFDSFSRKHGCKLLVWFETHDDIEAAIRREKLIKRWRRAWKISLVEARNPEWADLAPALRGAERFPWETMAEFQTALEPDAVGLFATDDGWPN